MNFSYYNISIKGIFNLSFDILKDESLFLQVHKKSFFNSRDFTFYDVEGNEVLKVLRPFELFRSKFQIVKDNSIIAEVEKKMLSNQYEITGDKGYYTIMGDFLQREFTIHQNNSEVAKVSRKLFRKNKKFGLVIKEGNDDLLIIAFVVIVAIVNYLRRRRNG